MKIKEQLQRKIAAQGLSTKTFEAYYKYCFEYFVFCRDENGGEWIDPKECGRDDIEGYLSHLANDRHVAKNTQNVALQALLYLYREVLGVPIDNVNALRAKRAKTTRQVMSTQEVARLLAHLSGVSLLASKLMYSAGLRISDVIAIRLKDISFDRCQLSIKSGKGDKWRFTPFPEVLHDDVRRQIESVRVVWRHDAEDNPNGVSLPDCYRKKCPSAARDLGWQFLFPGDQLSKGHEGIICRHHRHPGHIGREIKDAGRRACIFTPVTPHLLRHSFASHAHEAGTSVRVLMDVLGHNSVDTTLGYIHADKNASTAMTSPINSVLAIKPPVEPKILTPSPMVAALANPIRSVSVSSRLRVVG